MRERATTQAGFTLIELMVVLVLIGIFSGLIVGEMRGTFEEALLRAASRQVINAANLANSQAVALNQAHYLWIEPQAKRLRIVARTKGETIQQEKLDDRITVEVRNSIQSSDEESDETPAEHRREVRRLERIEFLPDGTAEGREIVLRDRMGVEVILNLNPVTGRIRLADAEGAR